jgi:hypothetical protein
MESKHTPSPWIIKPEKHFGFPTFEISNENELNWIAQVSNDYMPGEANAHLIAAAPDMYEALLKLKAWNEKYPPGQIYDYGRGVSIEKELTEIVNEGIAVIAKAENKQP